MFSNTIKPVISHLLDLSTLNQDNILYLFERTIYFKDKLASGSPLPQTLSNKKVINLFYEPSTRTQYSFELAARNLGALTLNPATSNLSSQKGESLLDTIFSFEAMGIDLFIIRHVTNNTPHFIANELKTKTSVINAGDGTAHHPTQALIDLFTISQLKPDVSQLNVAIVGDLFHSRVAKSLLRGLHIMGITKINLIGPDSFTQLPNKQGLNYCTTDSLQDGLHGADVVVCLRIQKERITDSEQPNENAFFDKYAITQKSLALAKPGAIVLHPGPINRGVEIESAVADGPQSQLLNQITNSVPMRMAIIELLLENK